MGVTHHPILKDEFLPCEALAFFWQVFEPEPFPNKVMVHLNFPF